MLLSVFLEILQACKINERRINMNCKTIHLHSVMRSANEGRIEMGILHAKNISKVYKGKIPFPYNGIAIYVAQ